MKATTPSDSQIEELAKAMTGREEIPTFIDAGYTYLGQFIAHDIVSEGRAGGRQVKPYLQLDSLYGDDEFYAARREGLFEIGPSIHGGPADLPRKAGVALIPDRRNDDNVVVAQFHLLWQRVHNFTLTSGCANGFAEARRLTTLLFQLVVVEDYLRQVLAPEVYCSYFHHGERWLGFDATRIPREFSHAAFRFGHSMVRRAYASFPTRPDEVQVRDLFRAHQPLTREFEVDWSGFFGWPGEPAQSSLAISTLITPAMRAVPTLIGSGPVVDVVLANLRAGSSLPPGREYAQRYGLKTLDRLGEEFSRRLSKPTLVTIDNLPLWPYVLLEAELEGDEGRRLGPLGSAICAETLANAIAFAQHSIYAHGPAHLDDVLDELGALGRCIRAVQRKRGRPPRGERSFSVRHLLTLLDQS